MTTEIINNSLLQSYYDSINEGIAIAADAPEVSLDNYTRLNEGDNRFQLVARPIYGAEVWFRKEKVDQETGEVLKYEDGTIQKESEVVRYRPGQPIIIPSHLSDWEKDKPRKFLAMLVYNYSTKKIEMLTASNKGLYESLMGILIANDDSVNPFKAMFTITKKFDRKAVIKGQSIDLYAYTVRQGREKEPVKEVIEALQGLDFVPDTQALFEGEDPFTPVLATYEDVATDVKQLEEAK